MSETEVKFIVGTFQQEKAAAEAMEQLKTARQDRQFEMLGAVEVQKSAAGAVETREVGITPAKGALGGVVLGAAVGILTGGAGLALGTLGGLFGGLIGRRRSGNKYTNDQIYHLLTGLKPGSSALLVVTPPQDAAAVEKKLLSLEAEVITADIPAELAERLHSLNRGSQAEE